MALQPIPMWSIPRKIPGQTPPFVPGPTPKAPGSNAPAWLQKIHGGFGKFFGLDQSSPHLTQDEQEAERRQKQMAMAATLLQSSRPRPKGSGSALADIGGAMQAGQQAGQQFTADAMRARIAAAQLAQATNPQERAEPSQVRIARILADPNTPEQVRQEIRAQMGPNMDPNDLLRSELLRLEIARERRDADAAATQEARDSDARAYAITSGLEQIDKIAGLTRSLEGTLMEPGPFADTRRVALGTLGKAKELAGMESDLPEQAAQMDMLVKGVNDQLIGLMGTQALGQGTNAKLAAYQRSLANENISPAAIMSIQAQLAKDLLAQAKSEGIDIPNRDEIEARIKEMEAHTSVTRPMIDAPAAIATATDIANMGVEQLQALDVAKLSDEQLRAARDRWDKLNAQ